MDHLKNIEAFYKKLPELVPQKVNLNGSSRGDLLENYSGVLKALLDVDKAMGRASPHGRDYQTHSNPNAWQDAQRAWGLRRMLIAEILHDVEHSAEMVANQ